MKRLPHSSQMCFLHVLVEILELNVVIRCDCGAVVVEEEGGMGGMSWRGACAGAGAGVGIGAGWC